MIINTKTHIFSSIRTYFSTEIEIIGKTSTGNTTRVYLQNGDLQLY